MGPWGFPKIWGWGVGLCIHSFNPPPAPRGRILAVLVFPLESTVQDIRHSYWNINRELVEDLREVVITNRRARLRSRLVPRLGNIYSFLAAPPCVKNP